MPKLADIPEGVRVDAYMRAVDGDSMHWVAYTPMAACFFRGEDPFLTARHTPDVLWARIVLREPWPDLADLDAYHCVLEFQLLTAAPYEELVQHYGHVADHVHIMALDPHAVAIPQGDPQDGSVHEDFIVDALHHLEAKDFGALKQLVQARLQVCDPHQWHASALRWLLLLLDSAPDNGVALRGLIESFHTLTPPEWGYVSAPSRDMPHTWKEVM